MIKAAQQQHLEKWLTSRLPFVPAERMPDSFDPVVVLAKVDNHWSLSFN
jgi:hypothetical protein